MRRQNLHNLLVCFFISISCAILWAADPVAPLNESHSFDADTGSYTLKVNTKGKTIKADKFEVIQGDPDPQHTIDSTCEKGAAKRVGTVEKGGGSVLYRMSGTYCATGTGTQPVEKARWKADYDYGGKRMILHVNSPSKDDDFLVHGGEGTATVILPFDDDDVTYTVVLRDHTGEGVVKFQKQGEGAEGENRTWLSSVQIELGQTSGGWVSEMTVDIHGHTTGNNKIQAENTAVLMVAEDNACEYRNSACRA